MNRKALFISTVMLSAALCLQAQEEQSLSLLFTGDIMCHEMQLTSALDDSTGRYCFDPVFSRISHIIGEADIAAGNFEVTLGGAPYTGYPAFSAPDQLAEACRNAGFDLLFTANNHSADRGARGISRTIRVLDSLAVPHTGTWISPGARDSLAPLILDKKGIRLAFLNYTYGTNGITVQPPETVSYIDTLRIKKDIAAANERRAEFIIVFIHWGNEYDTLPSPQQKKTADAIFRAGANMIVGSHPHVIQPMNSITGESGVTQPVVWSMGNFVSNQRNRRTDGGAMIRFVLSKENGKVNVTSAGYILTWVYSPTENRKRNFYILPCSEYEGNPAFFQSQANYSTMKLFTDDARRLLYGRNTGFSELIDAGGVWVEAAR